MKPIVEFKLLLCLIGERLDLGRLVAAYKWQNNLPILDEAREQVVLSSIVTKIPAATTSRSQWFVNFFQDQMEANRNIQEYYFEKFARNPRIRLPRVDLVKEVRPKIDSINQNMIRLAQNVGTLLKSEYCAVLAKHELNYIIFDYGFDKRESCILQSIAMRHVCSTD